LAREPIRRFLYHHGINVLIRQQIVINVVSGDTVIVLALGAVCLKTLDGTIVGKPTAAAAPIDIFRKALRDETGLLVFAVTIPPCRRGPHDKLRIIVLNSHHGVNTGVRLIVCHLQETSATR
jgi:hypothetical protein